MKADGDDQRRLPLFGLYGVELLLLALAASGFGVLASESAEAWFHEGNVAVLRAIRVRSSPALDQLAIFLSWLGGPQGITVNGVVATVSLWLRRRRVDAITLALVLVGGTMLTMVLKPYFQRPRPDLFDSIVSETGYGFPSSHAIMGFCLYGALARLVVVGAPGDFWRYLAGASLLVLASAIAWSRLYLGVHWLTDVVAGALVAVFWLTLCLSSARAVRRWYPR